MKTSCLPTKNNLGLNCICCISSSLCFAAPIPIIYSHGFRTFNAPNHCGKHKCAPAQTHVYHCRGICNVLKCALCSRLGLVSCANQIRHTALGGGAVIQNSGLRECYLGDDKSNTGVTMEFIHASSPELFIVRLREKKSIPDSVQG